MKNKNILALLESHVDKIVLAVCALAALVLLWFFVIGNPYGQKIRVRGPEKKLSPSKIDQYIEDGAEDLLPELEKPAPPLPSVPNYLSEYTRLLQSPLSEISSSVRIPSPGVGDKIVQEDRLYALPEIPALGEVAAARLRGAAKVPTEEVGPDRLYASVASEVEDIDLVTVSASFDAETLYNNFQQSFMGPRLKTYEKDTRLATPVFARLQMQRRIQQDDGNWAAWETVRRTAIDPHRELLEELPAVLAEDSFGVNIWMSQYEDQEIQYDILQPEAYLFTISRLEWMAPEFLDEALEIMEKQELQAAREEQEELRERRSTKPAETRRRTPTRRRQPRGRDRNVGMPGVGEYGNTERTTRPSRAETQKERTVEIVQEEFENERLNEKNDIDSQRDSLLIWAHDDTVKPGKTYQYQIRIGVFNPIAGKDWLRPDQEDYKNQLILWSDYSEPTEPVSVPRRVYVFPMDVVADKDAPDAVESVQVEVAKYYLGRWRDFDFDVYPGQVIGYEVEDVESPDDKNDAAADFQPMMGEMGIGLDPETVDFTSDITLVDIIREITWGSRLRAGSQYNMLYYDDEKKMQKTVVGKSNWDSNMRDVYDEIQTSMKQDVQRRNPGMPTGEGLMDPMMMDPMMMQMMMQK